MHLRKAQKRARGSKEGIVVVRDVKDTQVEAAPPLEKSRRGSYLRHPPLETDTQVEASPALWTGSLWEGVRCERQPSGDMGDSQVEVTPKGN